MAGEYIPEPPVEPVDRSGVWARRSAGAQEPEYDRAERELAREEEGSAEKPGAGDYCPAVGDEGALRMGRAPCG